MKRSNNPARLLAGFACLALAGCATVQPMAFPIGTVRHSPKPATAVVQLYQESPPARKYTPVARLNVHIEKTFFMPSAFAEARPKLEDLARFYGADAIIQVEEKKSRLNETFIYNVSAVAVVFTE